MCVVCKWKNVGATIQCEYCERNFHVTCAIAKGWIYDIDEMEKDCFVNKIKAGMEPYCAVFCGIPEHKKNGIEMIKEYGKVLPVKEHTKWRKQKAKRAKEAESDM